MNQMRAQDLRAARVHAAKIDQLIPVPFQHLLPALIAGDKHVSVMMA
jgi:hypothetical protein